MDSVTHAKHIMSFLMVLVCIVAADVAVFVAITLWNVPIPGWLHPFLFYIQVISHVVN